MFYTGDIEFERGSRLEADAVIALTARVTMARIDLVRTSSIIGELNFDSLAQLEFIAEADSAGFTIDAQKLASAKTVQDLIDLFE